MAEPRFTPDHIGPTEDEAALMIRWADGHESVFRPHFLRVNCPCAGCVDEMTGVRMLKPEMIPSGIYPLAIEYVGRYALQFRWSDGHSTGLYSFELLRGLSERAKGLE